MKVLRIVFLAAAMATLANCASTQPENGVIETTDYVFDLGEEQTVLVKEAASTEEDSE